MSDAALRTEGMEGPLADIAGDEANKPTEATCRCNRVKRPRNPKNGARET